MKTVIIKSGLNIKNIVISPSSLQEFINKVRSDIYDLLVQGRIEEKDVKISIPLFIQEILDQYIRLEYWDRTKTLKVLLGNHEIVPGYNNQICVFNENAYPNDFFVEPFEIEFDEK